MYELEQVLTRKVSAGAAKLDEQVPDWFQVVDPDSLDMWDQNACVLGQIYREQARFSENSAYTTGLDALGLTATSGEFEYGFAIVLGDAEEYEALNRLWKQEIEDRRRVQNLRWP